MKVQHMVVGEKAWIESDGKGSVKGVLVAESLWEKGKLYEFGVILVMTAEPSDKLPTPFRVVLTDADGKELGKPPYDYFPANTTGKTHHFTARTGGYTQFPSPGNYALVIEVYGRRLDEPTWTLRLASSS